MTANLAYRPGSITKNLGLESWEGEGFGRLAATIRNGFGGVPKPTSRAQFRERTGELADRHLVPLNFFLHNDHAAGNIVSKDELVRAAFSDVSSDVFSKLALFALHLSRVGDRTGNIGHSHGAGYLRDFVIEQLWQDGRWQSARLCHKRIESFLQKRVMHKYGSQTVHKITTNYSRMLTLAGFEFGSGTIEPDLHESLNSCLFLAFDRYTMDELPIFAPDSNRLIALASADQLYKLLGCSEAELRPHLLEQAYRFIARGGIDRP